MKMTEYKNNNSNLQFNNKYFKELYDYLWRYEMSINIVPGKNKNERLMKDTETAFINYVYFIMMKIEERLDDDENAGKCNPDGSIKQIKKEANEDE